MTELTCLRSLEAFRSLTVGEARRLMEGSDQRIYEPGATILRRGEHGDEMFVILDGEVEVRVPGDDGRVRFTTHLSRGDIFGEMALLTEEPRVADVVAVDRCKCLAVDQEHFERHLRDHPPLAAFLTETLGRRILESDTLRQVGKYHLLRVLGEGSMTTVFEGYHQEMNRRVAMKMLSHSLVSRPEIRERFLKEARILASLRHENIVQVYDLVEAYRTIFIVMERLDGLDLEQVLARDGRLNVAETRRVVCEIASALAYAHDHGITHGDIKPANVIRQPDGSCRLVDFGIAAAEFDLEDPTEEKFYCSPAYVAPEVIQGERGDSRSDLYSLGAMAYRLLTGRSPYPYERISRIFEAHLEEPFPDPVEHVHNLPADLIRIIQGATQKRRKDRFQHAREIVDLLAPAVAGRDGADRQATLLKLEFPREESDRVAGLIRVFQGIVEGGGDVRLTVSSEDDVARPSETETGSTE